MVAGIAICPKFVFSNKWQKWMTFRKEATGFMATLLIKIFILLFPLKMLNIGCIEKDKPDMDLLLKPQGLERIKPLPF